MAKNIRSDAPPINGLVLAGGESSRMGVDKGLIDYHGIPQREYLFNILHPFVAQCYISCRPGQIEESRLPLIEDRFYQLGPFGAVLTAFDFNPQVAWLIVACDFPLLDQESIQELVNARQPEKMATCFWDDHSQKPEPWITILEPDIHPVLQDYLAHGKSSLRGVLEDSDIHCIKPADPEILLNANTPEEAELLRKKISKH